MARHSIPRRAKRAVQAVVTASFLASCAVLKTPPDPVTVDDRLSVIPTTDLPLKHPVTIRWDEHQVPFVIAEDDADAAFALGLVHAHLRLGQLEVARRVAQGRISEMAGPFTSDIDKSLRILDIDRAADDVVAAMPEETRVWVQRFVDGINHYQRRVRPLPHEYQVLGLGLEQWTPRDIVAIGRLGGVDVNWLSWVSMLPLRDNPEWPRIWRSALEVGADAPTSIRSDEMSDDQAALREILAGMSRSGSNSVAVSGRRSASGGALLASDPHLGMTLPNLWLIAGLKSPSYHVVGLMPAGIPIFALGRNAEIGWGGTNLRAASSDLFDVTDLPEERIETKVERVGVRFWFDDHAVVRRTPLGPIITDAPLIKGPEGRRLALRWIGHDVSDEITSFLRVARAKDWAEFRAAFIGFAVSGQTMVYGDRQGNVGLVTATRLPRRPAGPPADLIQDPKTGLAAWNDIADTRDLPSVYNPERGFVASANNPSGPSEIPLGFFFSPADRVTRLNELLSGTDDVSLDALQALQRDVLAPSSVALRDTFARRWRAASATASPSPAGRAAIDLALAFDGHYRTESREALAFEAVFGAFAPKLYEALGRTTVFEALARSGHVKVWVERDLADIDDATFARLFAAAGDEAAEPLSRHGTWGDVHRLRLQHILGNAPLIGSRYRFADLPVSGSLETLYKTAHSMTVEPHGARYGSQSRHISDMADPDANQFVLLGGQDGWLGSPSFVDQAELWRQGRYVQVPLTLEKLSERFSRVTRLEP